LRYFIFASHGDFAQSLYRSVEMILGKQSNVKCISALENEGPGILVSKIESAFSEIDLQKTDEIFVLTDMLGGGITNLLIQSMKTHSFRLIAGVNLPFVLELFTLETENTTDEKIEEITERSRRSMVFVNKVISELGDGYEL